MLRAVSTVYIESQALVRRDVLKFFRLSVPYSTAPSNQTVLSNETCKASSAGQLDAGAGPPPPCAPPPPPPSPPRSRRAWTAAAALALTASLGGVYFYRKLNDEVEQKLLPKQGGKDAAEDGVHEDEPAPVPARAEDLPAHVQYLLVGGGTASFAAMRAIRSARPDAQVLIVSAEPALPYMRPPLSKELWREPELAARARSPDALTFRQWNGRRRSVTYEPPAFYTPPERLREAAPGAGVARGWRVTRVRPERHEAELSAPGAGTALLTYDKCLIATGVQPRRLGALRAAAGAGRAVALRSVRDVARLADLLDAPRTRRVLVVGGGLLASELSAALADRLRGSGKAVLQAFREEAPLARVLPRYLAADAGRRLAALGVRLLPCAEITDSEIDDERVRLRVSSTRRGAEGAEGEEVVEADLVVECVGSEVDARLAAASGLELHEALGGLVVNAELQARADVFAAGDAACLHDPALGRRRVEHHDHAVVTGRLAGENMAALRPPRPYSHQSMFWSDLGPNLGYEAVGIIDAKLPTVGVFSADAVTDVEQAQAAAAMEADATESAAGGSGGTGGTAGPGGIGGTGGPGSTAGPEGKQYERGVVFYLRDERVVGVLLWNIFNRIQVARQVVAQGKFDDLFEVAKLFTPHEED